MKKISKKPFEIALDEKIFSLVKREMPREFEKANREYNITHAKEIEMVRTEDERARGFLVWFIQKYTLKEKLTPLEWSLLLWKENFSEQEIQLIRNALNYVESFFNIEKISENKKTYTLKKLDDKNIYTVQTIDLAPIFKDGDILQATLVPRLEGDYFFKGNIAKYTKKNAMFIHSMMAKLKKMSDKEESRFATPGKKSVTDKSRLLEAQHEMVESVKEYFGMTSIQCKNMEELKDKLEKFYDWRNKNWIVPGKYKTPEQLWKENSAEPLPRIQSPSIKRKQKHKENVAIVADTHNGIAIVPLYEEIKTFFRGDYAGIPGYWGFLYNILVDKAGAQTFVIKQFVMEDEEKSLKIIKEAYDNIETVEDMIGLFASEREDWSDAPFYPTTTLLEDI